MIAPAQLHSSSSFDTSLAVSVGEPLVAIIKRAYAADLPFLIEGGHGVGKSESVHEAARQLGIPVIDRDLSILDSSDIAGYPYRENGFTKFAPPDFLPKPSQPKGLLLLEELNRSSEATRQAALQILSARRIHDYVLAPGWVPCTTINPRTPGKYFTCPLDAALLARFVRVQVKADPEQWLAWARGPGGVHPIVTEYIGLLDEPFEDFEGLSNPRAWTYVSKLLHSVPDLRNMPDATCAALASAVAGLVGNAHASAVMRLLLGTEKPLAPPIILAGPSGWLATVRRWRDEGRLDILATTLRQLLRHLRPQARADRVLADAAQVAAVRLFFSELPPDLSTSVTEFIKETGYHAMASDEPESRPGPIAQRKPSTGTMARLKMATAASRARAAANGSGAAQ